MTLALAFGLIAPASADYTLIIPQEPGGGTSVWATIVARGLEKKLGEPVVLRHIPGAREIVAGNKFQESLRFDPKTIMVAHGGMAENYLTENVAYRYDDWAPIGLMNLNIVISRRADHDPYERVSFPAGSGHLPDITAIALMVCGPQPDLESYVSCFKEKVTYVRGMNSGDRRMAFERGEITSIRETASAHKKFIEPQIASGATALWFQHGVLDLTSGKVGDDPNFPGYRFQDVYKAKWGEEPSGDLYDAYLLAKSYRDVLQKSLWVDANNPNKEVLREALREMTQDPEIMALIEKDTGKYEWIIGDDVHRAMASLHDLTTEKNLKSLVLWMSLGLGQNSFYRPELIRGGR